MTRPLRIVIAEDEEDIRLGFRRLLVRLGYEVVGEASNGRELVELCTLEQPDLIITDVQMPELSGIEAVQKIARTQTIPVIVLSSYEQPDNIAPGLLADFLLKPVSMPDLQAAIKKACPSE